MSVWKYQAIDLRDPARPIERRGEVAGDSAPEVRAALRAVGLQVLSLEPERGSVPRRRRAAEAAGRNAAGRGRSGDEARAVASGRSESAPSESGRSESGWSDAHASWLRGRRVEARADLFDALANLLASGVPLVDAFDTIVAADAAMPRALRRALVAMRERLRSGDSLSEAMRGQPSWFDAAEISIIDAAQVAGTLAESLQLLAERQGRAARLGQRLVSALAYPAVVACVGVAVALFLATRTLPQLASILVSARLEVPRLTQVVMDLGAFAAAWWWLGAVVALVASVLAAVALPALVRRASPAARARADRLLPIALRRLAVSRVLLAVAELLRAGVPLVEALRVVAPTNRGLAAGLAQALCDAARGVESGHSVSAALDAPAWFDAELRRLVAVGESGGDLDRVLVRLGERYERQVARMIDRLAALLEPAVIVVLAVFIGIVVMAAVLPLMRLQEVL
jgi:type II secretory pathway component PulF